jgi:hypothetical protein
LRCQLALIGWAVASAECSTSTSVRLRDACGSSSTRLLVAWGGIDQSPGCLILPLDFLSEQ